MSTDLLATHLSSVNKRIEVTTSNMKRKVPQKTENNNKVLSDKKSINNCKRARNINYIGNFVNLTYKYMKI